MRQAVAAGQGPKRAKDYEKGERLRNGRKTTKRAKDYETRITGMLWARTRSPEKKNRPQNVRMD